MCRRAPTTLGPSSLRRGRSSGTAGRVPGSPPASRSGPTRTGTAGGAITTSGPHPVCGPSLRPSRPGPAARTAPRAGAPTGGGHTSAQGSRRPGSPGGGRPPSGRTRSQAGRGPVEGGTSRPGTPRRHRNSDALSPVTPPDHSLLTRVSRVHKGWGADGGFGQDGNDVPGSPRRPQDRSRTPRTLGTDGKGRSSRYSRKWTSRPLGHGTGTGRRDGQAWRTKEYLSP